MPIQSGKSNELYSNIEEGIKNEPNQNNDDDNKRTTAYHLYQAEESLKTLKQVVIEPGWKKILTHKSGVVVSSKLGFNNLKIPLFMGEHIIDGFTPQAIFGVIGMRKLWDEWYEEGNLVENLSDTTSCTYMVMKGMAGSKVRDLSLVEKIECTPNGTISFIATSVDNPKVPCINGRIRAEIKLHGWILEPISFSPPKTKVIYVLQVQVNGWIPAVFVKKYMARRPVIIHTIESYLQKNGPPPMIISNTQDNSTRSSAETYNSTENMDRRRKVNFREQEEGEEPQSKQLMLQNPSLPRNDQTNRSLSSSPTTPLETNYTNYGSYPIVRRHKNTVSKFSLKTHKSHEQIKPRPQIPHSLQSHRHTESAYRTLETFKILSSSHDDWDLYSEKQNTKIYMKNSRDSSPSLVRGETIIRGGFTPEDILSIIKSMDLKKYWDDRYDEGEKIEILGHGDLLSRVSMKGTFPICGRDLAIVTRNEKDPETGIIWTASSSVVDPLIPEDENRVRANLELAGWKLRPIFDESIKEYAVEVIYIVDIDIKFDTVPVSILKTISSQTPMCVERIDELINKIGHPPYVIKSSGEILSEELNTITYQYDLKIGSVKSKSITEIKTSNIMHHGFNINVIPENSKVEVLSHNKNIIRITLPHGIEVHTLNIKITRSAQGSTFNGKSIPVVSSELVEEITLSKPIISNDSMVKLKELSNEDNLFTPETITKEELNNLSTPKTITNEELSNFSIPKTITKKELNNLTTPETITKKELNNLTTPETITKKELNNLTTPKTITKKELNNLSTPETITKEELNNLTTPETITKEELDNLTTPETITKEELDNLTTPETITKKELDNLSTPETITKEKLKENEETTVTTITSTTITSTIITSTTNNANINLLNDEDKNDLIEEVDEKEKIDQESSPKYIPQFINTKTTSRYIPEFDFSDQSKIVDEDEMDQESAPKYVPQFINTKTTSRYIPELNFIQNVIPSNNNEDKYKDDSIEVDEDEMDQESSPKYIPQFINTKTTSRYIPEYNFIHNVIPSNNKRDSSSIPSSSTTRSSRRISSRMLPESMMNLTRYDRNEESGNINNNDNRNNINNKIIRFIDTRIGINLSNYNETSFTPQETALMFFSMIVSYYAGKFNGSGCVSK